MQDRPLNEIHANETKGFVEEKKLNVAPGKSISVEDLESTNIASPEQSDVESFEKESSLQPSTSNKIPSPELSVEDNEKEMGSSTSREEREMWGTPILGK
ncbi:hypothetical protein NQ314_005303 [Rhamnusium bicolor]|uniref:Uncharacterized protein n=1 Tax=Rhamnusium bicolor TaxID=1586634 RepID=A0AAV8ZH71_9CUCU|nr:hypothetical protein NQ314_005303 [Rhamnusium bicolor]